MANDGIDKLAKTLAETVPQGLRSMRDDLEKNFRTVLQSGLGRLDLVTREEFDVQQAVLKRTREKLEELEVRLATIESGKRVRKPAGKKPAKKTGKRVTKKKSANKKSRKKPKKKSKR